MKRSVVLLLAFVLIGLNAISQNTLGLKAGINLAYQTSISTSNLFPKRTMHTKPLFGYQFGIFYKVKVSKKLSFSTEANLSLIGAKDLYMYLSTSPDTAIAYNYINDKIGYIEVPLMIQYNLDRFYVSAGPSFSIKLFSKSVEAGGALDYKFFDLAGKLLAGCHVSQKWNVNICYSYGLIDVNKSPFVAAIKKNSYLNLSLLYALK